VGRRKEEILLNEVLLLPALLPCPLNEAGRREVKELCLLNEILLLLLARNCFDS